MDITIQPGMLRGTVAAIPSKSQAHRLLICAALADKQMRIFCDETNEDIEATADCLSSLDATTVRWENSYHVTPLNFQSHCVPQAVCMNCRESGSTLRFMLPICGALGVQTLFRMEGRLSKRPLSPLWEEMERMGCRLSWGGENELLLEGKLKPGDYYIDGSVSSQFITGLLFATSILDGDSTIHITGKSESKPYITMTQRAMELFGVNTEGFHVRGGQKYRSPGDLSVEGDWSNGAFWLAAKYLENEIEITNLSPDSPQGDRAVAQILPQMEEFIPVDASDIPDLVPILAVAAGARKGARFTNIQRLRLKESDRVAAVIAMIKALGGKAESTEDTLTVHATGYSGGIVDSVNDHRIAMAAAIAATVCKKPVTILGAEAVKKSYPSFWEEYRRLGGNYEQYLR